MELQPEKIIQDLKNKVYHPIYLLEGEETYFIDKVAAYIEDQVLSEAEKGFNQRIIYGKDTNVKMILELARQYPMMANYQVIIVREAQALKNWDGLEAYAEKPLTSTILVLCYKHGAMDKRLKVKKALTNHAVVMTAKKMYDDKVPEWINQYVRSLGYSITPHASALMVEQVGNDLSKLVNELEKLFLNIPKKKEIDAADIEKFIGISKEFNVFEFSKALGNKDILKANQIIKYFSGNQKANPMPLILGSLYTYFSKLFLFHRVKGAQDRDIAASLEVPVFFVKDYKTPSFNYSPPAVKEIINIIHHYDLRLKGLRGPSVSEPELLKEMVYKILHVNVS